MENARTHGDRVGLGLHVIHRKGVELTVAGRGQDGVSVVVDGFNAGDGGGKLWIHGWLFAAARGEQQDGRDEKRADGGHSETILARPAPASSAPLRHNLRKALEAAR